MSKWDVIVMGSVFTDFIAWSAGLPTVGEEAFADHMYIGAGGRGANQAVAAARLGAKVALVGRVGADDRAEKLIYHLRREGVDTRWVMRTPGSATGVIVTHKDHNGDSLSSVLHGANARLSVEDIHAVDFASARVLLMQLGIPLPCVLQAARLAHAAQTQVMLDPAPPLHLPDDLYPLLSVIKPNTREAAALTGITPTDRASAHQAARQLLNRGVGAAVVQGGDGNLLLWGEGEGWLPHLPVDSVDTTGAGDTFAAALALMRAHGHDWAAAGHFAQVAAALATTDYGAQTAMPHRQKVLEFMERGQ